MTRSHPDGSGDITRRQALWLGSFATVMLVTVWTAQVSVGSELTRDVAGNVTGAVAAVTLVYVLTISRRWGKRTAFALLVLWIPLLFLGLPSPVGFGFTSGDGIAGSAFGAFMGTFLGMLLMRLLFWDYAPSREELKENRRATLRGLGIVGFMVAAVLVFLVGTYLFIEYAAGPLIRYFA